MKIKKQTAKLTHLEISAFCSQMGDILHSGISAMEGLTIFIEDAESDKEKELLTIVYNEFITTGYLHNGLEKSGVFPAYMINMVKLGEETGSLDTIMYSLAEHYEREDNIQTSIHNALTYPVVMLFMMFAVITIIITKVLPIFNQVFSQLGTQMNSASVLLMNLGQLLNQYSIVFLVVIALILLSIIIFSKTVKGRRTAAKILSHLPAGASVAHSKSLCRLCDTLKLSIESGFPSTRGLELADELIDDETFSKKIQSCMERINAGEELPAALMKAGILTSLQSRMMLVGSKTGSLEHVLAQISSDSEAELDQRLSHMIAIIEPTLVAVLSVITGIILLSVMLPLLGILSGF